MKKISKIITAFFATFIVFSIAASTSASASELELTQEQKEVYYKEYVSIIEKTNSKYNKELELAPIEEMKSTDWKTPEEFQEIVEDMATAVWVAEPKDAFAISPMSTDSASKSVSTTIKNTKVTVTVNGKFTTILSNGRQIFSQATPDSITSSSKPGSWTQKSYSKDFYDGSRTVRIDVGGSWTYNGVSDTTIISVEFYCSSGGSVS